jgi:hypothetical protein
MPCSRCAGLTVPEMMREGGSRAVAQRCVICGDLVDHVIVRHRACVAHPRLSHARTPIFNGKRHKNGRRRVTTSARPTGS